MAVIIQADEESLARLLGVLPAQIPEFVQTEYELRLSMFHRDGGSGPLGTIAIIDLLRFLKLGRRPPGRQSASVDWSRLPTDGSVRVIATVPGSRAEPTPVSGVYLGQVGVGSLAIRLDGDNYVHELHAKDVRLARSEEPTQPISPEEAYDSDVPIAEREPWVSLPVDELVLVRDESVHKEGRFQAVEGDQILVLVADDLTPRPFPPEAVTCLESRLKQIAEKRGKKNAEPVHSGNRD